MTYFANRGLYRAYFNVLLSHPRSTSSDPEKLGRSSRFFLTCSGTSGHLWRDLPSNRCY
jgi:hypothetical protein